MDATPLIEFAAALFIAGRLIRVVSMAYLHIANHRPHWLDTLDVLVGI